MRGAIVGVAMALPALRNVDVSSFEHEGRTVVHLRDPEGYVEAELVLTPEAFFIAAQLDGTTDVRDIQYACAQYFGGRIVPSEDILKVADCLNGHGFLQSERFEDIRRKAIADFARLDVRAAALAGKTYPSDPGELQTFLDSLFTMDGAPGKAPSRPPRKGCPHKGLIVPHIDFQRGAASYAHGYSSLFDSGRPETAFIFGVAHAGGSVPFILTKKDFQTPFGTLETDKDIVAKLEAAAQWDPYADELVHRSEHSIEFQAVMLAHLFGTGVRIVPILCAAFSDDPDCADPAALPHVTAFLAACRDVFASCNGPATVVAAADLAHVGRRFGQDIDLSDALLTRIEVRDREDLAYVTAVNAQGFYQSVMKDRNARQVCGANCIYAALQTLDGTARRGELLSYGYAPDPGDGVVSFASVALS